MHNAVHSFNNNVNSISICTMLFMGTIIMLTLSPYAQCEITGETARNLFVLLLLAVR